MKIKIITLALVMPALIATVAFIDLANPDNYTGQGKPNYINKDNTPPNNPVTNKGATLGRVLFYDKNLSANKSISCSSCHIQKFAFGDTATQGKGHLGGLTNRHAMRLVNARFGVEQKFFWDERATSLEDQTTRPVKDAVEMGFSGTNGQGNMDSLISRLHKIPYYKSLFSWVYGDTVISESRLQLALAQFIRSIQSFDSKFDQGLAASGSLTVNFSNYTIQENLGKTLFLAPPPAGGAGCQGCHGAPEFDIDPNTKNNGVIATASNPAVADLTNTRAPSLRNLFNPQGQLNGPLMHNGAFKTIDQVINHYNNCPQLPVNTNLDPRLQGPGGVLNLSLTQKNALIAFLKTLSGNAIYTDPKWSDPFDATGNLSISTGLSELTLKNVPQLEMYPNPASDHVHIQSTDGTFVLSIFDAGGRLVYTNEEFDGSDNIEVSSLNKGVYFVVLRDTETSLRSVQKLVKE